MNDSFGKIKAWNKNDLFENFAEVMSFRVY